MSGLSEWRGRRGNVEAGLRLLLKSEKPIYQRVAEVGIEDLSTLTGHLERLELERDAAYADAENADAIATNVWREEYDKVKKRAEAAEARVRELEEALLVYDRWG